MGESPWLVDIDSGSEREHSAAKSPLITGAAMTGISAKVRVFGGASSKCAESPCFKGL